MRRDFLVESGGLLLKAVDVRPDNLVNEQPTIVVLGGFLADQLSTSSEARGQVLENEATELGFRIVRFNFLGHGEIEATRSEGSLEDVTITKLIQNAIDVCRSINSDRIAFVASSIGAGICPFVTNGVIRSGMGVAGVLGISALPPAFLRAFIVRNLSSEQKIAFESGDAVMLSSPTLPISIPVRSEQFDDLQNYSDYPQLGQNFSSDSVALLYGKEDPASSATINNQLALAFGASENEIIELSGGHSVDFGIMSEHFRSWAGRLDK